MGRGVLRPEAAATRFRLARHAPSEALAPFVEYYWIPRWDLRGEPPFRQAIMHVGPEDRVGPEGRVGPEDEADVRMIGYAEALLCSVRPERDRMAEQVAALVSR